MGNVGREGWPRRLSGDAAQPASKRTIGSGGGGDSLEIRSTQGGDSDNAEPLGATHLLVRAFPVADFHLNLPLREKSSIAPRSKSISTSRPEAIVALSPCLCRELLKLPDGRSIDSGRPAIGDARSLEPAVWFQHVVCILVALFGKATTRRFPRCVNALRTPSLSPTLVHKVVRSNARLQSLSVGGSQKHARQNVDAKCFSDVRGGYVLEEYSRLK
jgi:hypothetical protein